MEGEKILDHIDSDEGATESILDLIPFRLGGGGGGGGNKFSAKSSRLGPWHVYK